MTMAELKTKENQESVNEFLIGITDEGRRADCQRLVSLMQEATGAPPRMWGKSIVGFGSYHYKYDSGREGDWFQTGFSPRKANLTLYIMPELMRHEDSLVALGKHKTGKSCIYIKQLADIDTDILRTMIADSLVHLKELYG